MAIKEKIKVPQPAPIIEDKIEEKLEQFISQGGAVAGERVTSKPEDHQCTDDHRLTLRIPKWIMDRVDIKRKQRPGTISRNLWILEQLEKATRNVAS